MSKIYALLRGKFSWPKMWLWKKKMTNIRYVRNMSKNKPPRVGWKKAARRRPRSLILFTEMISVLPEISLLLLFT